MKRETGKHKKIHEGVDFKLTSARCVTDGVNFRSQTAENGPIVEKISFV